MNEHATDITKASGHCEHGNVPSTCPKCVATASATTSVETGQRKDSVETKQYSEKEIESFFEAAFMVAEMINEGKEGIIATIDVQQLPDAAREYFIGDVLVPETHAIKMLKVHKPGAGKREFDRHDRIYNLLHEKEGAARIPKPYRYKELPIKTAAAREKIAAGFHIDPPPTTADIIIMDLIEGRDLASIMHRFVVANHEQSEPYDKQRADEITDVEAQRIAQRLLHYRDEKILEDGTPTTQAQKDAALTENEAKLDTWLTTHNFTLPNTVRLAVSGALSHMHGAGIHHRDLHRRNVMVGNDGTVFLIDFGKSHVAGLDAMFGDSVYAGTEGEYLHDDNILRLLRSFEAKLQRAEQSLSPEATAALRDMDAGKKRLEDAPNTEYGKAWTTFLRDLEKDGSSVTLDQLQSHIAQLARILPSPLMRGLAALECSRFQPSVAREYVKSQLERDDVKSQTHIQEKFERVREIINASQPEG